MSRTIVLQGCPIINEDGNCSEEIRPGHLVSGVSTIVKHASAGGITPVAIALEREELGSGIDNTYQSSAASAYYASGDTVKVGVFAPGMRFQSLIDSGVNVVEGDLMESAGNGTFRKRTSGQTLARALQEKNVTATTFIELEAM